MTDFDQGRPVIRSRKNDRLRLVRALASARGRRQRQRFLLEGPKAISDLVARRPADVEQVLFRSGELRASERRALDAAQAAGVDVYPVAPELFSELAPSESPQGVLAVAHLRWTPLAELLAGADPQAPRAVIASLGIQDPGNLGTILRSARFFGCAGLVILPGTQDPYSPKVVRSTAGTLLQTPPARAESLAELLSAAAQAGLEPIALAAHEGEPLETSALPQRCLLLAGAEGQGLPAEAAGVRALTIASPEPEQAESLNVAIATSLVAHAWSARWRRP